MIVCVLEDRESKSVESATVMDHLLVQSVSVLWRSVTTAGMLLYNLPYSSYRLFLLFLFMC